MCYLNKDKPETETSIVANLGTFVLSCGDSVIDPDVSFRRTKFALLPD